MDWLSFLIGFFTGGIILFLLTQWRNRENARGLGVQLQDLKNELEIERAQNLDAQSRMQEYKEELEEERNLRVQLQTDLAGQQERYRGLEDKLQTYQKDMERLQERFTVEFKHLAHEIFEEKTKKFTEQNKVNLGELLNPLRDKLLQFEKKVDDSSKESVAQHAALKEQLQHLRELNQQINQEAENLTRALKGDTKTQGNWGEFILESILEKSGLRKGEEYVTQESQTSDQGRRRFLDVVVKLPDDKNIIIDSKVTLVAYEKYVNEEDELEKSQHIKAHMLAIRKHLKDLSEKDYQKLHGISGLDFVLMFIPIEAAFSLAVQNDREIFSRAYEQNIVLVSPTTLLATLRTISNIWKNEYQNRNALEIARQGGDLYDKFVSFTEDLKNVGRHLDQTKGVYVEAMKKLIDGRGNLVGRAEKIRKLGAKTSKLMDQKLLDRSKDE